MARNYELELLSFLKLFKKQELLGFSFERKTDGWSLFLHFPSGVIQISGKKEIEKTIYASLISETVLWEQ